MSPPGPFVRLTIDQLAQLIRQLSVTGADLSYNDLPPGAYDVVQSDIAVAATIGVILPQNPNRFGLLWGRSAAGTVRVSLSGIFSANTGFPVDATPSIPEMIGRRWYEVVKRDWFGIAGGATTVTCVQLLRVGDIGGPS